MCIRNGYLHYCCGGCYLDPSTVYSSAPTCGVLHVFTVVVVITMPSELLLNKLLKIPIMLFCKRPLPLICFCFLCYRSTVKRVDTHNMQVVYEEVGETRYTVWVNS